MGAVTALPADPAGPDSPQVRILATDPTALEGGSTGAFTILRDRGTNAPLTVNYAVSGTASNGVDYVRLTNLVIILPGRLAADVVVQPIDNGLIEKNKTVVLALLTNATYRLGSPRTAEVTIIDNRFNDIPPTVSLTSPTNGTVLPVHANLTLAAEAADPDDPILRVLFFADDHALGSATNPPYSLTWSNVPPGRHTLYALAKDTLGETAISKLVRIRVTNTPPVVALTHPTNGAFYRVPTNITLTAEAHDPDGAILKVSFYANGRFLHTTTENPYTWTWTNVPPDHYRLTAKATDEFGTASESAAVSITVSNVPPAVTLTAPTNGSVFHTPPSIPLAAAATDPDDAIQRVSFFSDGHLLHSVTHVPYTWVWTNASAGDHQLTAAAVDQWGATTVSKPVRIRVIDVPPAVKWLTPTNGARILLPAIVPLTVQITNDYGQVTRVSFYANDHLLASVTNAPYTVAWTNPPAGQYELEVRALDRYGGDGGGAIEVRVVTNRPPSVEIVSPRDLMGFGSRTNFVIRAMASEQDGQIRQVEFFANGVSLGVRTNPTEGEYRLSWNNVPPANYTLTAVATDDRGVSSTSRRVQLIYATAALVPRAQGSLREWPERALVQVRSGDGFVSYTKDPTTGRQFGRAYFEFGLLPLLSSATRATLVLGPLPSSITNSLFLSFYPADLEVDTNDLEDATVPLTIFSAASPVSQSLTFDVTGLVQAFAGTNLGFEIRFADDPGFSGASRGQINVSLAELFLAFPSNLPPVVRIINPTNNTSFPQSPANFSIDAEAEDVDGTIQSVLFFAGDRLLGRSVVLARPNVFRYPWWNVPAGTYALRAKATDNLGLSTTSAPVQVSVRAPPASPGAGGMPDTAGGAGSTSTTATVSPFPAVDYLMTLPDGRVQLTITGPAGGRIVIESSPNFTDWTSLAVVTNATGTVQYLDAGAHGSPRRFYRVKPGD